MASNERFRVERQIHIDAPPAAILPLIEDFHRWTAWSPYEAMDPDQQRTYSGAARGVGAIYQWNGRKSGAGRMEILSVTPTSVSIQLDFTKPMTAHNIAEFTAAPDGAGSRVTWSMNGPVTLMSRVMSVFMSMDKLVGGDFEKGLAAMKRVAEAAPAA